jgi:ABC-type transport system involved in cytochrome c biogenesis permease subunit
MSLIVPFMVVLVMGLGFVIERSSMTKSMKAVTRLVVLGVALAVTFYWVRTTS